MIVKIEDKEYIIKWEHRSPNFLVDFPGVFLNNGSTWCRIFKGTRQMAYSVTQCGLNDQYCKNEGRKISLERALKKTEFNKVERRRFWEAYGKMRNGNFGNKKRKV